jgi:putative FmdB family regulatory protein
LPLYAYRCTQCGYQYEKVQKFNAEPETVCPQCGGKVERPLTAPALQFKGAGWYINDYAPKPASGGSAANSSGKPAGDAGKAAADSAGTSTPASSSAPATSAATSSSKE